MISFFKKLIPVTLISLCFFGGAKISYAVESLLTFSTHFTAVVANTTYYLIPNHSDSSGSVNTNESITYFIAPTDGRLQNLYIAGGEPGGSNTITATMRIEGVDTLLSAQLTGTTDRKLNSTTTIAVSAGQKMSLKIVTSAALGGAYYIVKASVTFKPTNNRYAAVFATTAGNTTVNSGTYYYGLMGQLYSATQSIARNLMPTSGKFGNFYFYRGTAPGAGTSETRTLQYNGTNSSIVATISDTSNVGSDTTHTQYVSATDLVGFAATHSGTPALTTSIWSATFEPDVEGESLMMLSENTPTNTAAYWGYTQGSDADWDSSQTWAINTHPPINYRIKKLYVNLGTAPGASKSWNFRVDNGYQVSSGVNCTISDSETACNDTTNSSQIIAPDVFDIKATPTSAPAASTMKLSYVLFFPPTPSIIPRQPNNLGLTGYWSFNDGSGSVATDSSGKGNHGTLGAGMTSADWVNGKRGLALDFDGGSTDNVLLSISTSTLTSATGTIAFWVKTGANFTDLAMLFHGTPTSGANGVGTENEIHLNFTSSEQLQFFIEGGSSDVNMTSTNSYSDGKWHYVVATWNRADVAIDDAIVYVDGVEIMRAVHNANSFTPSLTTYIGRPNGSSRFFTGQMDEVRIYNRALSPSEVDILYRSTAGKQNFPVNDRLTSGLIGNWTFNDPDITTNDITDVTGNGNRGGFIGSATSSAKMIGKIGQALAFNGTSNYVRINDASSLDVTNITVSVWAKKRGDHPDWAVLVGRQAGTGTGDLFTIYYVNGASERYGWSVRTAGGDDSITGSASTGDVGIWVNIVGTYNGTTIRLYRNGVEMNSKVHTFGGDMISEITSVTLGAGFNGAGADVGISEFTNASLDEARVYNRALSASEVKQLYLLGTATVNTSQNSRIPSGLVGYWSLNGPDITANDITDVSGNSNRGGLFAGATSTATVIGKVGQGFYLNDAPYIKVADSTSLDFGDSFSYALWLKRDRTGVSPYEILVSKGANSPVLSITGTGDTAEVRDRLSLCKHSGACVATSTIKILDSEWHHIALTKSGATTKLYIDAVDRTGTVTDATMESNSSALHIGAESPVAGEEFKGTIDEIRVYNRAITPAEVFQLYRAGR